MNVYEALKAAMEDYTRISGLRTYFVQDIAEVNDAKEKNYFCKCLKTSSKACDLCEISEKENYAEALKSKKPQSFACHAGLIKWSVPVDMKGLKGAIVSEGVITEAQVKDREQWVSRLALDYNVSRAILDTNYASIHVMNEDEAKLSIEILSKLLDWYALKVE